MPESKIYNIRRTPTRAAQVARIGKMTGLGDNVTSVIDYALSYTIAQFTQEETEMKNISERYGEPVEVTIDDYQGLNPNGEFEMHTDGIREYFEDGTWELVAE